MLPEIQNIKTQDKIISQFLGLNQKDTSNDQMFKDMENMTSDEYPYLAPRNKAAVRHVFNGDTSLVYGSCVYGEDIYTVQGQRISGVDTVYFYKNFQKIDSVILDQRLKIRDLVVYGAYIVIFPDNVMYNAETEEVIQMTLEKNYGSSETAQVYLSDANGVPFICNEYTGVPHDSGGQTVTWYGITQNIGVFGPTRCEGTVPNAIKVADVKTNYILNNYTNLIPSFIPGTFAASYEDNTTANLRNINVILNHHNNLKTLSEDTHFNVFELSKTKNGQLVMNSYNQSMNAFMPVDLYVTLKLTTTDAASLEESIKPGDYIELDLLDSNGELILENQTKDSWYEFIKRLNNKIKVEKVLRNGNDIGFVIKQDSFNFLEMLKDAGDRMNYKQVHDFSSDEGKHFSGLNYFYGTLSLYGTTAGSLCSSIKLSKKVPDMDYITVSQNRIWGCSSENHEIYACKQGDATAWYNYAGLSSDSYAVTIPNGDKFTGAVTYSDMPYFFTENMAYSIMGNKPKNYQVQNYELRGVEDGASHTIAQKDGYIYYKSKSGIERFNGNNAQLLTEYLDLEGYRAKVGAVNNDKYFVFMGIDNAHTKLYVYDIKKRLWHIDRKCLPNYMIELDNNLYLLNGQVSNIYLEKINGKSREVAPALAHTITYDTPKWFVESGEFNGDSILKKYITKLMFELKLEQGSKVSILFMYDDSGEWEEVFRTTDKHVKKLINVPLLVRRCERLRYKIKGEGQAKIYTITFTYEGGSEIG